MPLNIKQLLERNLTNSAHGTLDLEETVSMKYLLTHFKDEIESVLIENCSTELKPPHLLPPISACIFERVPFSAVLTFFLTLWKNLVRKPVAWLENP